MSALLQSSSLTKSSSTRLLLWGPHRSQKQPPATCVLVSRMPDNLHFYSSVVDQVHPFIRAANVSADDSAWQPQTACQSLLVEGAPGRRINPEVQLWSLVGGQRGSVVGPRRILANGKQIWIDGGLIEPLSSDVTENRRTSESCEKDVHSATFHIQSDPAMPNPAFSMSVFSAMTYGHPLLALHITPSQ